MLSNFCGFKFQFRILFFFVICHLKKLKRSLIGMIRWWGKCIFVEFWCACVWLDENMKIAHGCNLRLVWHGFLQNLEWNLMNSLEGDTCIARRRYSLYFQNFHVFYFWRSLKERYTGPASMKCWSELLYYMDLRPGIQQQQIKICLVSSSDVCCRQS